MPVMKKEITCHIDTKYFRILFQTLKKVVTFISKLFIKLEQL